MQMLTGPCGEESGMASSAAPTDAEGGPAPRAGGERADEFARRRIRVVLSASAVVLVTVMLLPILTSFTSALDGVVAGVSVAYIVGFFEFVFALAGAVAYCRWIKRMEARMSEEPTR